jgi:Aminotransferase class-V
MAFSVDSGTSGNHKGFVYTKSGNGTLLWRELPFPFALLEFEKLMIRHFSPSAKEIVVAPGAPEGINLIAKSCGKRHIEKGVEIIVSTIEHHADIVSWHELAAEDGAVLRVIPMSDDGQVLLDEYEKLLNPRTRLLGIAQVSNALGTILPSQPVVAAAHRYGARMLVDGAQTASHHRLARLRLVRVQWIQGFLGRQASARSMASPMHGQRISPGKAAGT